MNICVILLSVLCLSSGLYFHIGETEKKCFIEDIPDDTMVVGKALFLIESVCISNESIHRASPVHSQQEYIATGLAPSQAAAAYSRCGRTKEM